MYDWFYGKYFFNSESSSVRWRKVFNKKTVYDILYIIYNILAKDGQFNSPHLNLITDKPK